MLFSIYPSDTEETQMSVLVAARQGADKRLFTSLHIPEISGFDRYLRFLKKQHTEVGFTFFADISPLTLERLHITIEELGILRDYGIIGVRIDFGFSVEAITQIAHTGLSIAVNASVMQEAALSALLSAAGTQLIAWHNYYPRPETGIAEDYFRRQNNLFLRYGIPVYTFIPGETAFRMPLHLGLPTLESQRYKNAYRNVLALKALCPETAVVCAEGIVYPHHLAWIRRWETDGIVTLPIYCSDTLFPALNGRIFTLRGEETDYSWRLLDTRSDFVPPEIIRAEERGKGSLQIDLPAWGRYQGEIHIMKKSMPLDVKCAQIGEIISQYRALIDYLKPEEKICFTKA